MRTACCPLCAAPVDDDEVLREHLDVKHDLRDDPGARTSIDDLVPILFLTDAEVSGPVVSAAEPPLRVHDPDADDERWKPVAIGLGGVLLLFLAWMAISLVA